jgi:hypothetical protein
MVQDPSWKFSSYLAGQEISFFYGIQKFITMFTKDFH